MESVASAIVSTAVGRISKHIGYVVQYKDNIKDLEATVLNLKTLKDDVKHRVDDAKRNLYQIPPSVENWLSATDDILQQVTPYLQDDIRIRNINLKSRLRLSRKVVEVKQQVLVLLQEAPDFHALGSSRPSSVSSLDLYIGFESKSTITSESLEALMDDDVGMISICGKGGIGKTAFVEQLVKVIQHRKVMDAVCWLYVSQNPDLRRIQNELADFLGLKFDIDSLDGRAAKLHSRFMREDERTLLILDDVWEVLDLKRIGIPPPGKANWVKILLTSQREDVCNRMGSQRNFSLLPLTDEEAWNLFKERAFTGDAVNNQDMHKMAREITRLCEGLPLAIITIASSLKYRPLDVWRDALEKLRTSSLQGFSALDQVYSRIKSSYDLLPTEEHKSCFVLCCLFPEDSSIPLEDLVRYGTRLGLFGDTDNFFQARERVHKLIYELKESSMLLEGDTGDSVRMHDAFRDFAISIASKDKSYICCDDGKRNLLNPDTLRSCTAMSLVWEETKECPVVSQCPNLEFLLLLSKTSSESVNYFFQGMKTGGLGNLVVLAIKTQSCPNLPEEIGLLTNLMLLDMGGMSGLKYVPPGVLSKLSKLNELYVTPKFRRWGSRVEGEDGERINASLTELESLPIIALRLSASKASILPKLHFFEKLVRCEIRLGNTLLSIGGKSNYELVLEGDASYVKESGITALLNKIEKLRLERVEHVKSFEHFIDDVEQIPSSPDIQLQYFCNLTYLAIESCGDLKHVFPLSLARSLSKIQQIRISNCIKMEGILYGKGDVESVEYPCLINLELIGVPNLNGFWVDADTAGAGPLPYQSSDDDTATKSSTHYLKGASSSMEEPSTSKIETKSSLVAEIGCLQSSFGVFPSWIRLANLEELRLQGCVLLRVAFASTVAEQLVKLKTLQIRWCWKMEYIVEAVGRRDEKDRSSSMPNPVFPKLASLIIDDLPELMAFSSDSHFYLEWSSLEELKVSKCPKIKTLSSTFPPDRVIRQDELLSTNEILFKIPRQLKVSMNVKLLEVRLCDNLTHLFSSRAANFLTGLEHMEISCCDKLKKIVGEEEDDEEVRKEVFHACDLLSLKSVTFDGCFQLKTFSNNNSVNTPNLKDIHINGSKYEITEDLNTTIEKLMSSKARIFDMKELVRIGRDQIPVEDWSRIRDLEIQGCDKLLNAIPCNLIAGLQKLEKLAVMWCDSLEEIFQYEGAIKFEGESDITFSHLEEITLFGLENLEHVFTRVPKTITGFRKLRKLYVHGCRSLRNIFSFSSVRGLLQLQELKVSSCNGLKEIVTKDDKEEQASRDTIVFPRLRSIDISDSTTLECFYSGIYDLVMPLLESLHLHQCPSMNKFSNGSLTASKLQKVQGDCKETSLIRTSPIVDLDEIIAKKKMQKRTQIRIYNRNDLQNIGRDQPLYEDLSQIQELEIQACDGLLCANLKASDLQKLEKLVVRRCHLLEEIFEHRGAASFGSGSITTFSNLEEITLFDLEKLRHVFYDIPEATIHFQKLRKLHIHGCNSLSNVFSVSTVNGLPELQELKLSSCEGLEEIVAQGKTQERGIKDFKIVFPQLRSIDIGYSSKLSCFYSGNYGLELPKLERLFLYKCPRMSFFTKGLLATGSLQKVQIDNANYKLLEDDLNDTMKYKDLLLRRDKNSQGLEDSEFTDGSNYSAARMRIAELEQENEMLKRQLASKH